ncbi:hypothetical protein MJH54_32665, partial [Salmonella enterica subsp. enterica serovar Montevideo]|nr:hypothetical protein [Salmonella enterica subsp. enterica serovar Montevideo]
GERFSAPANVVASILNDDRKGRKNGRGFYLYGEKGRKSKKQVVSTWIHNNVVKAVRLGPVALSGGLWRDFQLGGGQVVTGFHTDG